jgi:hypothetical protein
MVNGLKVPSRLATLNPSGTLERRRSGFVDGRLTVTLLLEVQPWKKILNLNF